jgi:hypothetical protein
MDRYQELDIAIVPRYEIDLDRLVSAQSEDEFLRVSFELLKEAAPLVVLVANTLDETHLDGFTRNEGILVGHLIRMTKLMRAVIAGIADEHGGDQQSQLVRQFLDSASTLAYLLEDPSDSSRFDAYVYDSLIAEREFLKDVRKQIVVRGGNTLNIELRIEKSIKQAFDTAGVTEGELPSRSKNGWPSAQQRLSLLGPTAYSAYRTGSGAIHGSWHDIERHHLELDGEKFRPYSEPMPEKSQPLFTMALIGISIAQEYLRNCVPDALQIFEARFADFLQRLEKCDRLHEEYLSREFD